MNKKSRKIILVLYCIALLMMVIGATYAYFQASLVSTITPQVDVGAATTEIILFDAGKPIVIEPTPINFAEGMGNLSSETFARATLTLDQGAIALEHSYNVYLEISSNNLIYTTKEQKPELLLSVTDPFGNEVTSIPGLEYKTVIDGQGKSVSGFDITTQKGKFYIASNYVIKTESSISHKWNALVTFVNLSSEQYANMDKEFNGVIQIEKVA